MPYSRNGKKRWLIPLLYFTTSLLIIGTFVKHTTALMNIGAYTSLLLSISVFFCNWPRLRKKLIAIYKEYQLLILLTLIFLFFTLITSLLASYNHLFMEPLNDIYKSIRYPVILFLCLLALSQNRFYIKYLYTIFLTTVLIILIVCPCILYFQNKLDSFNLVKNGAVSLGFLAPFVFTVLLIDVKKYVTYTVIATIFLLFIYIIWSGSRSGLLATASSLILISFAYIRKYEISRVKVLLFCIFSVLAFALTLSIAYRFSPRIQEKVQQTVTFKNFTSGRTTIIRTRYPVINQYVSFWHGIGYGNTIYQTLLHEQKAPEVIGQQNTINGKSQYFYYHDEPQLLVIYYSIGMFGIFLYLAFFVYFTYKSWINKTLPHSFGVLSYAIFSSLIAYFLLRGFVEHSGITLLMWLLALQLPLTKHFSQYASVNKDDERYSSSTYESL